MVPIGRRSTERRRPGNRNWALRAMRSCSAVVTVITSSRSGGTLRIRPATDFSLPIIASPPCRRRGFRIRRIRHAIRFGWRTTSPRPRRPQEDRHDASLRATAGFTPFVRALGRIGPAPGGRSARTARTTAGAARGRGARFAPPHGLRQPCHGRRDRVARPGRPRRAGPATLLRSGPVPRHLRGDRHRRAGRSGKDTGSATWRPARPSRPTRGSTSVR